MAVVGMVAESVGVSGGAASCPFRLDEASLREAEDAAEKFVDGPWKCGVAAAAALAAGVPAFATPAGAPLLHGACAVPRAGVLGAMVAGMPPSTAAPGGFGGAAPPSMAPSSAPAVAAPAASPQSGAAWGGAAAPAAAGAPPSMRIPATSAPSEAPVVPSASGAPAAPSAAASPASAAPKGKPAPAPRERWSTMSEEDKIPASADSAAEEPRASAEAQAEAPPPAASGREAAAATAAAEGEPGASTPSERGAPPPAPAASAPPASPAPGGQVPASPSSYVPRTTWANIVSKEDRLPGAGTTARAAPEGDVPIRRDTILDYLLFSAVDAEARSHSREEDEAKPGPAAELPEELEKFRNHPLIERGVRNVVPPRHNRRGMRNDANSCYVNVVVQSLLPCGALMQLLSHCARSDRERPFYTGMARICKEFHNQRGNTDPFNALQLPQVKDIISAWQALGAQQDASEFLFYMLNGMHEECKWKAVPAARPFPSSSSRTPATSSAGGAVGATDGGGGWADRDEGMVEVRSAGVHEDSPIVRIFGGLIQSSLRCNNARTASVSLEPFNHLTLDISSEGVDSVRSALEAYCRPETVDDGRATKRLQFRVLPRVLVLTLKRFSYNKDTGTPQKVKKAVQYEERLIFDGSWLVDEVEAQEYQLYAVICHHGDSANGGHYNAAVRYESDWYMFDDALVRQMDAREVMNQMFTAYILLYQTNTRVLLQP